MIRRADQVTLSEANRFARGESPADFSKTEGLDQAGRRVSLVREFTFEAAHTLPFAPAGHKCRRLHGHSFRVELLCEGEMGPATGWLLDFGDIKRAFAPLHDRLDHNYLNEIEGLENPTAENIARWIWVHLKPQLPVLAQVTIAETCSARCIFRG
jgi:6-pyruvoyltetrahydropterin/6-carboxytetrahydropterin synthase